MLAGPYLCQVSTPDIFKTLCTVIPVIPTEVVIGLKLKGADTSEVKIITTLASF